jgi:hypothetical protein
MSADDFQWLADKIELHFPVEVREHSLNLLAELQQALEEFEANQQRRQIRELGEEFLRQKEVG